MINTKTLLLGTIVTMMLISTVSLSTVFAQTTHTITMVPGAETGECEPDCFVPGILSIDVGDAVTFVNSKPDPTLIASGSPYFGPDDYFQSGPIGTGQSFQFTFSEEGIYPYFDMISPWMQGKIQVGSTFTNTPPVVNAGINQVKNEGDVVVLSGSATDAEGDQIRYTWKQTSGIQVSLSGSTHPGGVANGQNTFFVAPEVPEDSSLTFELTARDPRDFSTDTVSIRVNNVEQVTNTAPVANAGGDSSFAENSAVTLYGTASSDDDGDTLVYIWEQIEGETIYDVTTDPLWNPNDMTPQFTAPEVNSDRNFKFKLLVHDGTESSSPDYATITIIDIPEPPSNNPPVTTNDILDHLGSDPVIIDVLFNDYDDDGDDITIQSIDDSATAGTVINNGISVTFDPTDGVFGETTFQYTISDGFLTDTGLVTVKVIDVSGGGDAKLYIPNPDAAFNSQFGYSSKSLGTDIVVGAPGENAVYVVDGTDGSEILKITNPAGTDDDFGASVATIDDGIIAIGAPLHDGGGINRGAVYIFDANTGAQRQVISPAILQDFDEFGSSITSYDGKIAIGYSDFAVTVAEPAMASSDLSLEYDAMSFPVIKYNDESAFLQDRQSDFQLVVDNYLQYNTELASKMNPLCANLSEKTLANNSDCASTDEILDDHISITPNISAAANNLSVTLNGASLSTIPISNSQYVVLVDAVDDTRYLFDADTGILLATTFTNAGAVMVFNTDGSLDFQKDNPHPASSDAFGKSVYVHNSNIIAGVPGDDHSAGGSGSMYYIDGSNGNVLQFVPNPSPDGGSGDDFGTSVGATDEYILVGAPDDDTSGSNWGAAWVIDPADGSVIHHLPNPRPDTGDDMGEAIAGTAEKVIVGEEDDGYVHVFDVNSGTHLISIGNPDLPTTEDFGFSLSRLGDDYIVGNPTDRLGGLQVGSVSVYSGDVVIPNESPVAVDDTASATDDNPIVIDVLANDYDGDMDSLVIDSVNVAGTSGTVINNGNDVTFTAELNFEGVTIFSYKTNDNKGGVSNVATVSVTVDDTIPPLITLHGENPQSIDVGAGYFELGASTADGSDVIIDMTEFTDVPGTYAIYYDSTDINENSAATITRTVHVIDNVAPTVTAPENQTFDATALNTPLDSADFGTATVIDNYDVSLAVTSDAPSVFPLGNTIITWSATDSSSNVGVDTQIITVQDTVRPEITLVGNDTITINLDEAYVEYGATAIDDIDGDITGNIAIDASPVDVSTVGTYLVRYNVSDSSGNDSLTVFREVIVESPDDTIPPIITLNGPDVITLELGDVYTELGATATDETDGTLLVTITGDSVDTSIIDTYTITYDAVDFSGNSAEQITRLVTVVYPSFKILDETGESHDQFGSSVSVYDTLAVSGAPHADGSTGAAFVFEQDGDIWNQIYKLSASDTVSFGYDVDVWENYVLVGAPGKNNGTAFVFEKIDDVWVETQLTPSGMPYDDYGLSVSIWNNTAMVGSKDYSILPNQNTKGTVFVFEKIGDSWQQTQIIDDMGDKVSLSGTSAALESSLGIRIYEKIDGLWSVSSPNLDPDSKRRNTLSLSGDTLFVGTTGYEVAVFQNDDGYWKKSQTLEIPIQEDSIRPVTVDVAVYGDMAVVGFEYDDIGVHNAGASYLYERIDNTWTYIHPLLAFDRAETDLFGSSLGIFDETVIVGSYSNEGDNSYYDLGAAYIFSGVKTNPDTIPPEVLLSGDSLMLLPFNAQYVESGYVVSDNHDQDVRISIDNDFEYGTFYDLSNDPYLHTGNHTITYTATDNSGNEFDITRIVSVQGAIVTLNPDNSITYDIDDSLITHPENDYYYYRASECLSLDQMKTSAGRIHFDYSEEYPYTVKIDDSKLYEIITAKVYVMDYDDLFIQVTCFDPGTNQILQNYAVPFF